jgi:hypothetical protein
MIRCCDQKAVFEFNDVSVCRDCFLRAKIILGKTCVACKQTGDESQMVKVGGIDMCPSCFALLYRIEEC